MSARRRLFLGIAVVILGLFAWRVARWLLPTEADRLAEQVEGLARRVLAGDLDAVLDHVDLERFGLRATALGEGRTFGPEDAERLLDEGREALTWFPLETASIAVTDSEVTDSEDGADGADRGRVTVTFAFVDPDDGTHYADRFDLDFRRVGRRWVLVAVALRTPSDPGRLGGPLQRGF